MRKIKEVLRLRFEVGLGQRQIARSCSIGLGTVHDYLQRAEAAGVTWPLGRGLGRRPAGGRFVRRSAPDSPGSVGDAGLRRASPAAAEASTRDPAVALGGVPAGQPGRLSLQPVLRAVPALARASKMWCCGRSTRPARSCSSIGRDRRSRSTTAQRWRGAAGASVRRRARRQFLHLCRGHRATSSWQAGSAHTCGPSSSFSGVPKLVVPDNPKTGVTKACRYDPDLNPHLSGDGHALRRRRGAGAALQAARQSLRFILHLVPSVQR